MKRSRRFLGVPFPLVLAGLGLGLIGAASTPQLSKLNPLKKLGAVEKLLKADPLVSTNLSDAVTEVPFLDGFNPVSFRSMARLPRGEKQEFVMGQPGLYAYEALSYCLKAGAHGPGGQSGFLYAPLKGKWAGIIDDILIRAVEHPEISQRDVQGLIWAILARTKIDDLPPRIPQTAKALLSPQDIKTVNGRAVGMIPDDLKREALSRLPLAARQVFEAEAKLREMFARGEASYERIEEVAVRTGIALPGEGSREVPRGRWSFHPEGYFVRYLPKHYSKTRVEISYPDSFEVTRDPGGRISRVSDKAGDRIEISYDDSVPPLSFDNDPGMQGYALQKIRFVQGIAVKSGYVFENDAGWENSGWTLIGTSAGRGAPRSSDTRFSAAAARIDGAREHLRQIEGLKKALGLPRGTPLAEIADLAHLSSALTDSVGRNPAGLSFLAREASRFVLAAWQDAVCRAFGKPTQASAMRRDSSGLLWAAPSGGRRAGRGGGASGNTSEQPLAVSSQGDDPGEGPCNSGNVSGTQGDVSVNGESMGNGSRDFSPGDVITTGSRSRVRISLGGGRTIAIGSNSNVVLPDLCAGGQGTSPGTLRVVSGTARAFLQRITGAPTPVYIKGASGASGVRGAPMPWPEPFLVASLGLPPIDLSRLWSQTAGQDDFGFTAGEIRIADLVLDLEVSLEAETMLFKAVKGPIKLFDSGGNRRILNTGEILRKSTNPASGELKEILAVLELH